MKVLVGAEELRGFELLGLAAEVAGGALCRRSRCGTVIVAGDQIIGSGRNDPPGGCALPFCRKDSLPAAFKSDRTCCIHAEQNAILDAVAHHPDLVRGSRLYFVRLGDDGRPKPSGTPYCTICSKFALVAGVAEFVLWHETGITVYDTEEYNELSFQHAN